MKRKCQCMFLVVVMLFSILFPYGVSATSTTSSDFLDIEGHWAEKEIRELIEEGIVTGSMKNGKLVVNPNLEITRAEFFALLLRSLKINVEEETLPLKPSFKDIDNHWAESYIEAAKKRGITNGYPGGTFKPDLNISRAEAVTTIVRAYKVVQGSAKASANGNFKDITVKHWAYPNILLAVNQGFVNGYPDNTFKPENKIKRAESFALIYRIINKETPVGGGEPGGSEDPDESGDFAITGQWIYASEKDALGWELKWDQESQQTKTYNVYRSFTDEEGSYELIAKGIEAKTYVDAEFNNFGETYYKVKVEVNGSEIHSSDKVIANMIVDNDKDELSDAMESVHGSDPANSDTDGDGLTDGYEVNILGTDPLLKDTNGNGIEDGMEDFDTDALTNKKENELATNPLKVDSDGDGLNDGDEVNQHGTDPLNPDTDGDEVEEGFELINGFDPLKSDTNGNGISDGEEEISHITEVNELDKDERVIPSVTINSKASEANTTAISNIEGENWLLNEEVPGYLGAPYDFTTSIKFEEAEITFEYDSSLASEEFRPEVFYFNEQEQRLEKVEQQIIDYDNSKVTATVNHFSTYILLNGIEWDKAWEKDIKAPQLDGEGKGKNIDVVFSIDSSGSMYSEDRNDIRKAASKAFVDKLRDEDRAAVVDFDSYANLLVELTTDKEAVKYAIDMIDSSGGTDIYGGVIEAVNEIIRNGNDDHLKFVIFLTDGDGMWDDSAIDYAKEHGVAIYTIGLGSGVNKSLLEKIATETGGKYFFADNADKLDGIFEETAGDTIDYVKDTDSDKIPDWYESNGIRLGTGKTIFTDYQTPYSDTDDLEDGEEIIPENYVGDWHEGIYFKMVSDPLLSDSDEDGIEDIDEPENRRLNFDITNRHALIMSDISYIGLEEYVGSSIKNISLNEADNDVYEKRKIPVDVFSDSSELKDFKLYDVYINDVNGFYGLAFKKGNKIAIIYRGTDMKSWKDWEGNAEIAGRNTHPQVNSARDFVAKVITENPSSQITVAGHSLGGFLTQSIVYNVKEANFEQADICYNAKNLNRVLKENPSLVRGVTYNSAGFFDHYDWFKEEDKEPAIPYDFLFGDENGVILAKSYDNVIANFAMDEDPLNTAGGARLGKIYEYTRNDDEPEYGWTKFGAHSLVYFYSKTKEMYEVTSY